MYADIEAQAKEHGGYLSRLKKKEDMAVDASLVGASFNVDDSSVFRMRRHGC